MKNYLLGLLVSFTAAGWLSHAQPMGYPFWKNTWVLFTWYANIPVWYALIHMWWTYGKTDAPDHNQEFWFIFQVVVGSYFCIYTITQWI